MLRTVWVGLPGMFGWDLKRGGIIFRSCSEDFSYGTRQQLAHLIDVVQYAQRTLRWECQSTGYLMYVLSALFSLGKGQTALRTSQSKQGLRYF